MDVVYSTVNQVFPSAVGILLLALGIRIGGHILYMLARIYRVSDPS